MTDGGGGEEDWGILKTKQHLRHSNEVLFRSVILWVSF